MPADGPRWIDLHVHSTASDGAYAPERVVQLAAARGLSAVALTDHDTIAGCAEAAAEAGRQGIEFVPGVELEARRASGTLHVLGYFVDSSSPVLAVFLDQVQRERAERNQAILERLAALGIRLDPLPDAGNVGRPHIAAALIRAGVVSTLAEAFRRFLGEGGAAHVPRRAPAAEEVVHVIAASGGAASLAHPKRLECRSSLELETLIRRLKDAGLAAIEVLHPDHRLEDVRRFTALAEDLDLVRTGGSDFHRFLPSSVRGIGFGRVRVPYEWLAELRKTTKCASSQQSRAIVP